MVHWPDALVFGPALVQVPVGAVWVAPLRIGQREVDVLTGGRHEAAPSPASFSRVTMKV